jgi:hypothetical protein
MIRQRIALGNRAGMLQLSTGPLRPEANARCGLPPLFLRLTCAVPSVDVLWRPLVSVAVVTHLVTHPPRGAVVVATGLMHPARTGLTMSGPAHALARSALSPYRLHALCMRTAQDGSQVGAYLAPG